jgi:hypothetical protein
VSRESRGRPAGPWRPGRLVSPGHQPGPAPAPEGDCPPSPRGGCAGKAQPFGPASIRPGPLPDEPCVIRVICHPSHLPSARLISGVARQGGGAGGGPGPGPPLGGDGSGLPGGLGAPPLASAGSPISQAAPLPRSGPPSLTGGAEGPAPGGAGPAGGPVGMDLSGDGARRAVVPGPAGAGGGPAGTGGGPTGAAGGAVSGTKRPRSDSDMTDADGAQVPLSESSAIRVIGAQVPPPRCTSAPSCHRLTLVRAAGGGRRRRPRRARRGAQGEAGWGGLGQAKEEQAASS